MILPIVIYGDPVLKAEAKDIEKNHPGLQDLIKNMFDTMDNARGVGLAAPQVGQSVRLFVVDSSGIENDSDEDEDEDNPKPYVPDPNAWRKVIINPEILEESDEEWKFDEGCLSIPGIRETVVRPETIKVTYLDENFREITEVLDGVRARIFQHEYDHIEGVLFIEHISAFKRSLINSRLKAMMEGKVDAKYPYKVYVTKKGMKK